MVHEYDAWMDLALGEARAALATDDVPIGAVILSPKVKFWPPDATNAKRSKTPRRMPKWWPFVKRSGPWKNAATTMVGD